MPTTLIFTRQRLATHSVADLTDLNIEFMEPDPILFPKVLNGVQVHSGFAIEHKKTASLILAEVKDLMAKHSSTHVILVRLSYKYRSSSLINLYRFDFHSSGCRSAILLVEPSRNSTRCL